jgi:uncharacterized protein
MTEYLYPHSFSAILTQLQKRISEPAPGLVQFLIGPRQIGKTTILLAIADQLKSRALYVAADAPEASLAGWWENVWQKAEDLAQKSTAALLIDEIQYLPNWGRLLKSKVDYVRHNGIRLHMIVSGSSALGLHSGSRETMAGRFEINQILHWPAAELGKYFKLSDEKSVDRLIKYGGYPGSMSFVNDLPRWRNYVRGSIIDPAIGRDILMMENVRKPALLRQTFAICIGHPAEIISLQKISGRLLEKGSMQAVAHYLNLLEEAGLVAAVGKYSDKPIRVRSSPPKFVVLNQAMLSSMENINPPVQSAEPDRFGRWMENACMAHAWNAGQAIHYWRTEPLEVDMILSGSWGKWAVEIKTGNYSLNELKGLFEFCRLYKKFKPLLLCDAGKESIATQAGIKTISWKRYLLDGITGPGVF